MTVPDSSSRKTIDKAMRILQVFSQTEPELSIGELSERLDMHKSVVSRIASALRDWRMLEKDAKTQKLRIGEGAFLIGNLFAQRNSLIRIASPHMDELVALTGQSSHVTVLEGQRVLVVATVESPQALRVIMRLGEYRPLHSTAAGKLFLAANSKLLDAVLGGPLDALTASTLSSKDKLRNAVLRAGREGIAWNRGENSIGAGAVAAPIFDGAGQMAAALSTVYPLSVVAAPEREKIGRLTVAAARRISHELGSSY